MVDASVVVFKKCALMKITAYDIGIPGRTNGTETIIPVAVIGVVPVVMTLSVLAVTGPVHVALGTVQVNVESRNRTFFWCQDCYHQLLRMLFLMAKPNCSFCLKSQATCRPACLYDDE